MEKKSIILLLITTALISLTSCVTRQSDLAESSMGTVPYEGYTIFNPQGSTLTYLIDNEGEVVHSWESEYRTGSSVYLLDNGNLLRSATLKAEFGASGGAGRLEILNTKSKVIWSYDYNDDSVRFHHDMEVLPNGNILLIAWERISAEEVLKAGRDPEMLPAEDDGNLWADHLGVACYGPPRPGL